ncbi:HAD family hydrolase [Georgenia yuyongxinii]|uniref:HAD family hydrolase n=1 Tax=Georgenia yuyongxinii TaxID=2589797 RepID=A0A552WJ61_9MICO|nr:HAD family hydrolase [Georgenia yuyongxinii]TRW42777.1 HAD family hydrolase [Georgenia yuyongxinii]
MSAEPASAPRAAFFDLDKTVLSTASSVTLARPLLAAGLLTRADLLRSAAAQLGYVLVGADRRRSERVREQLSLMVDGWEEPRFRKVVDGALSTFVQPRVYREAVDLIQRHHDDGADVVVVSASAEDVVRPIAAMLGADEVIASAMEVVDGHFTGRVARYVYGPAKADAIRALAAQRGYDLAACAAYSDSVTDLPMLEAVGHPVAVNPDRALRRTAVARGWPVHHFARPVPLRTRSTRPLRVGAGSSVVVGLIAAGATILRRAHRAG